MVSLSELQFDGLVGPTHNYAGLSPGNVASAAHAGEASNPRAAAHQGLAKMRFVRSLGVAQAVLPPQDRPSLSALRRLGFHGPDEEILASAAAGDGFALRLCSSASAMWTANAATVAPSVDAADGRVHLTPANLQHMFHRAIEPATTTRVLRAVFTDPARFVVHDPLPGGGQFADEGAANHLRLETSRGSAHVFAWGRATWGAFAGPTTHPARQTREASAALARLHRLATYVGHLPSIRDQLTRRRLVAAALRVEGPARPERVGIQRRARRLRLLLIERRELLLVLRLSGRGRGEERLDRLASRRVARRALITGHRHLAGVLEIGVRASQTLQPHRIHVIGKGIVAASHRDHLWNSTLCLAVEARLASKRRPASGSFGRPYTPWSTPGRESL